MQTERKKIKPVWKILIGLIALIIFISIIGETETDKTNAINQAGIMQTSTSEDSIKVRTELIEKSFSAWDGAHKKIS